jgi:GTPase SAR1 family protein
LSLTGSGKTTFLHRLVAHSQALGIKGYVLNLDPAVLSLPFTANIDIRDTVNYKNVMKEYNLGPNGAILTSLNLFATKFDEVMSLVFTHAE